jgi:NAD-specific glutamate dehydrogenase
MERLVMTEIKNKHRIGNLEFEVEELTNDVSNLKKTMSLVLNGQTFEDTKLRWELNMAHELIEALSARLDKLEGPRIEVKMPTLAEVTKNNCVTLSAPVDPNAYLHNYAERAGYPKDRFRSSSFHAHQTGEQASD